MDTIPTLTIEVGNFAPRGGDAEFTQRKALLSEFFGQKHYDAIALGQDELTSSISEWIAAADSGLPILAANLYGSKKSSKPLFEPYKLFERDGLTMGVVGLVSERAAKTCADSANIRIGSPYSMKKLFKKLDKKTDLISIIGDFTLPETDSLSKCYPSVDVILSPSIPSAKPVRYGNASVMGCGSKGYFGDYIDLNMAVHDSTSATNVRETLDSKVPADTSFEQRVAASGIKARK